MCRTTTSRHVWSSPVVLTIVYGRTPGGGVPSGVVQPSPVEVSSVQESAVREDNAIGIVSVFGDDEADMAE